jgi:hypothetical protein
VNVDEQAQIQLLALSLKELIQSSAMTALDQLFVFLAVIMRSLSQSPAHSARRSHRRWCVGPKRAKEPPKRSPDPAGTGGRLARGLPGFDPSGAGAARPRLLGGGRDTRAGLGRGKRAGAANRPETREPWQTCRPSAAPVRACPMPLAGSLDQLQPTDTGERHRARRRTRS